MLRCFGKVVPGLVVVALGIVACGLDVVGEAPIDSPDASRSDGADAGVKPGTPDDPSSPSDAGVDAGRDAGQVKPAGPCSTTSTACQDKLATDGWKPVIVPASANAACPANYTTKDLVKDDAKAAFGACSCTQPIVTEAPSCDDDTTYTGLVSTTDDKCTAKTNPYVVQGGGCTAMVSGVLAGYGKFDPITKHGKGTCATQDVPIPALVTATALRLCGPPQACAEDTCLGKDSDTVRYCVEQDGDHACPAAFPKATRAADRTTLSCDGCDCKITGQCGAASIDYYADTLCQAKIGTRQVNGQCLALEGQGGTAQAFKYRANPNFTAGLTSLPKATVGLDPQSVKTVCCR